MRKRGSVCRATTVAPRAAADPRLHVLRPGRSRPSPRRAVPAHDPAGEGATACSSAPQPIPADSAELPEAAGRVGETAPDGQLAGASAAGNRSDRGYQGSPPHPCVNTARRPGSSLRGPGRAGGRGGALAAGFSVLVCALLRPSLIRRDPAGAGPSIPLRSGTGSPSPPFRSRAPRSLRGYWAALSSSRYESSCSIVLGPIELARVPGPACSHFPPFDVSGAAQAGQDLPGRPVAPGSDAASWVQYSE